jgi:preprotein translocase SecE subunit
MAKTRAQRKAERRKRQAQLERQGLSPEEAQRTATERDEESRAQHDTQVPRSGDEAEFEAVLETGAKTEDYGERVEPAEDAPEGSGSPVPGVVPAPIRPKEGEPEAPAPSKADVGRPDGAETKAEPKESRRARRQREKQERRQARAREQRKADTEKAEKRRGPVVGFLASCWAELKRVQWPDRDTLVQASAVTVIFVAVMAAYLGALDAAFNWLIQRLI